MVSVLKCILCALVHFERAFYFPNGRWVNAYDAADERLASTGPELTQGFPRSPRRLLSAPCERGAPGRGAVGGNVVLFGVTV